MPRRLPDDLDRRLGRAIRLTRRMRDVSQAELGAAIGVSAEQVRKFETARNRVTVRQLFYISAALRIPVEVLLLAVRSEQVA